MTKREIKENIKAIQDKKREESLRQGLELLKVEIKRWCAVALVRNQMRLNAIKENEYETL